MALFFQDHCTGRPTAVEFALLFVVGIKHNGEKGLDRCGQSRLNKNKLITMISWIYK